MLCYDEDPVPPVHRRQVCPDPACKLSLSEDHDQTSQAAEQKKNASVCKYFKFIGGQNLSWRTLVPVFRKRKQPVPYLRRIKVSLNKGIRVNIQRENTETGLRVFSLSVLKTHLSNESGWLIPETLLTKNPQHRSAPSRHNNIRGHDGQQRKGGKTYPRNGDSRKRTGFLSKRIEN